MFTVLVYCKVPLGDVVDLKSRGCRTMKMGSIIRRPHLLRGLLLDIVWQNEVRRRMNAITIECMYKLCVYMYLLVNTAHTYEHESTVAVTKARV